MEDQSRNRPPKESTFRFAIGVGDLRLSSIWSLVANKTDVYVGVRSLMGSFKMSIHGAEGYRRCHIALTKEYWPNVAEKIEPPMESRDFNAWAMPSCNGGAAEIASIWFPRDHQLKDAGKITAKPSKPVHMLPPAPPGRAVRLRLLEMRESPTRVTNYGSDTVQLLGHFDLDDGRKIALVYGREKFDASRLRLVRKGQGGGRLFDPDTALAPGETLSDLAAVAWAEPEDGASIHITELHGFSLSRKEAG